MPILTVEQNAERIIRKIVDQNLNQLSPIVLGRMDKFKWILENVLTVNMHKNSSVQQVK